jgi:hypothetical protein
MFGCSELRRGLVLSVLAWLGWAATGHAQAELRNPPIADDPWAQVLSVSKDWIVLQNAEGQQLPVNANAIRLFVIRWPTTVDRIRDDALLEITGLDLGSYRVQVDHVDVYEGAARNLVAPGMLRVNAGWAERPIDFTFDAPVYGEPFPGIAPPPFRGFAAGPLQINVVGALTSRNPLTIGGPGINNLLIVPAGPGGYTMNQITPGSIDFVRPGDLAYFWPVEARLKSLILDQLVIYKRIPLDQFQR